MYRLCIGYVSVMYRLRIGTDRMQHGKTNMEIVKFVGKFADIRKKLYLCGGYGVCGNGYWI